MNKLELLENLVSSIWAINSDAAEKSLLLIAAAVQKGSTLAISPEEIAANKAKHAPYLLAINEHGAIARAEFDSDTEDAIAIIPVSGVLTPDGYYGVPGTTEIQNMVRRAEANENVKAILYLGHSPGGTVAGTERASKTITEATKPAVTHVKSGIYSAAVWLLSSSHIMLDGETAGIGSIGTMYSGLELVGILEKMGAKSIDVVADTSPDKNKSVREMLEGNPKAFKVEVLNPLNAQFMASVKANRGEKLQMTGQEPLTGKVYYGSTAVANGLADSIGSFDDAVAKAFELAGIDTKKASQSNIHNMSKPSFKALTALAEKQAKGEAINAADIQAVNDELQAEGLTAILVVGTSEHAAASAAFKALRAQNEAAAQLVVADKSAIQAENFSLETAISDKLKAHTTEVQGLNQQITALKAESAEDPAPLKKEGQEKTESSATSDKKWEEYPHNQQALKDLDEL